MMDKQIKYEVLVMIAAVMVYLSDRWLLQLAFVVWATYLLRWSLAKKYYAVSILTTVLALYFALLLILVLWSHVRWRWFEMI